MNHKITDKLLTQHLNLKCGYRPVLQWSAVAPGAQLSLSGD